jgi:hypothetical protein
VFTDEWGGGTQPMCQATSMLEMGGNTTLTITKDKKLKQGAYFKIPSAQTKEENCVSHNGGLVPVPGRDIMVQGWYQGGVDVIDFTDPNKPFELAFFDRGPVDSPPLVDAGPGATAPPARTTIGGSWGAYYYNGYIFSSELARGMDIMELTPSDKLSANEIACGQARAVCAAQPAVAAEDRLAGRVPRWCGRISTSLVGTMASPARAGRRSAVRSTRPRSRRAPLARSR